ncbi:MAG: hypothetical protein IJ526_00415 [Lachnospiraceae bacterium]|nr:hypothetical protein [Lachnospiraceae bacterium]
MEEVLKMVSNELCQISVKGIDTVHMANALKGVSDVIDLLKQTRSDSVAEDSVTKE